MIQNKILIIKDILGNDYLALIAFDGKLNDLLSTAYDIIPNFQQCNRKLLIRNNGNYHLTCFNVTECSKLNINGINGIEINDLVLKGIGSISKNDKTTYYIVCESLQINNLRQSLGFDAKDLHITIGFTHKDLFHDRKNITNIYDFI